MKHIIKLTALKHLFIALMMVLFSFSVFAETNYTFDKTCQLAYYSMMSLKFDEARKYLAEEKIKNPDNLIPYFIENYADFFSLAINEDANELVKTQGNKDKRLTKLSSGKKDSPWYLYTQAEVNMQWAFVHLKFEDYYTAFFEIKKAYKYLQENDKKFPSFVANKKSLGLIHSLIGTVPDSYKWAASFLGFTGTISQGIGELNEVLDHGKKIPFLFTRETNYIMANLQMLILNSPQTSWQIVTAPEYPDYKTDLLANFVRGHMAVKNGYNDVAIETFKLAPKSEGYMKFYYIEYLLGMCKMDRLDPDANIPLEKFIKEFQGRNYLKDAYQKLGWYYLLKNDDTNYKYNLSLCKLKGAELTDSDKQAQVESESGVAPNPFLLKVRLQQDGGYYDKALALLVGKSTDDFLAIKDKIEFTYRAARIYHEKGEIDKAIQFYHSTITRGEKYPYYFAANAALQLGLIYEEQGLKEKASEYFHKCLAMKNTDYKNSLDQKAKAGLNRLGKA